MSIYEDLTPGDFAKSTKKDCRSVFVLTQAALWMHRQRAAEQEFRN